MILPLSMVIVPEILPAFAPMPAPYVARPDKGSAYRFLLPSGCYPPYINQRLGGIGIITCRKAVFISERQRVALALKGDNRSTFSSDFHVLNRKVQIIILAGKAKAIIGIARCVRRIAYNPYVVCVVCN